MSEAVSNHPAPTLRLALGVPESFAGGRIIDDCTGSGINNLLDIVDEALGSDHGKDTDFGGRESFMQALCAGEGGTSHSQDVVDESDLERSE
jgi:hypothetical protein